ncbi:unnamed protein product [Clonostachys rosea f. rosea IK726]|uniref:Uncharacterized protein n=1 Tax=Clonostachys rosea f. rosea IK726 TaxID=1349383 RepID=A0ACA9UXB7_BIOOC|nr:unnamed protein product [Clonostachys rosea f. rosea IK726]
MNNSIDASDFIVDIREYDVPYHVRVMIDLGRFGEQVYYLGSLFANFLRYQSRWLVLSLKPNTAVTKITPNESRSLPAEPVVLAFDIETTKMPLKFPDAATDQVMMISYMIDGQVSSSQIVRLCRKILGTSTIHPSPNTQVLYDFPTNPMRRLSLRARPTVIATYNGDFFDWPFVEARASVNGIDLYQEIGWKKTVRISSSATTRSHGLFHWVNRRFLSSPRFSRFESCHCGQLGYHPDELDPELMTPYAAGETSDLGRILRFRCCCDLLSLYEIRPSFHFSLCTILPTGTLCEMLLMVQAYQKGIVLPNKHIAPKEAFWDGHLLDSETYVGGHVESIEAGVFRADIPVDFSFVVTVEENKKLEDVENYDEVREQIAARLLKLKNTPNRHERPLIYHLDVASMYPNICRPTVAARFYGPRVRLCCCDFNRPGKTCDRRLPWAWRGEYIPAKRDEYNMIRNALRTKSSRGERHMRHREHSKSAGRRTSRSDQTTPTTISQKIYHKIHDSTPLFARRSFAKERIHFISTRCEISVIDDTTTGQNQSLEGQTDSLKSSGAAGERGRSC